MRLWKASEGRTYPTAPDVGDGKGQVPAIIRVRCGREKPSDSLVAINNRNYWYWINDTDRRSKVDLFVPDDPVQPCRDWSVAAGTHYLHPHRLTAKGLSTGRPCWILPIPFGHRKAGAS